MADIEFVNPSTGAALGTYAFGTVAVGTASAAYAIRVRYKWGQTGSGLNSNALVLQYSTDGGVTWESDLALFTLAVTAIQNTSSDALFLGTTLSARRTNRLVLPPLRAGCAYDLALVFSHPLVTGAATTTYTWRLGLEYNQSYQPAGLVPDAPYGVLSGLGCPDVSEWITAPTLTNDTDKVTLGNCAYVHEGVRLEIAGGDVALSQDDGSSVTLSATEEYVAVLSVGAAGAVTVTKGDLDTAGTAGAPAYPVGELPLAVVRVPYGGVIVTSTLVAVSGRCAVSDAGGLDVTIQPGRVSVPGYLVTPATVQTLTLADDSTSTVSLSEAGVANVDGDGAPLATVVCASGDISSVTDVRRLLGLTELHLRQRGTETAATAADAVYVPYAWTVDSGEVRVRAASTGATGSTDVNVELDGTTFGSGSIAAQGTSDALAFVALSGAAGWITLDVATITSGGTQAVDVEVVLWIARTA